MSIPHNPANPYITLQPCKVIYPHNDPMLPTPCPAMYPTHKPMMYPMQCMYPVILHGVWVCRPCHAVMVCMYLMGVCLDRMPCMCTHGCIPIPCPCISVMCVPLTHVRIVIQ